LLDQTVVLIGGSSGIGLETAPARRAARADVVPTGRDPYLTMRVDAGAMRVDAGADASPVIRNYSPSSLLDAVHGYWNSVALERYGPASSHLTPHARR
jgi:NAD(P)-dependent dehydrogenase (short-subunit alcohol dehydrogenase family)